MRTVAYSDAHNYEAIATGADAIERWQAWARRVLETHQFRTARGRRIWALYAGGKTYTAIQRAVGCSRRAISRTIENIEAASPTKPCRNPWRRSPDTVRPANWRELDRQRQRRNKLIKRGRWAPEPEPEEEWWIS